MSWVTRNLVPLVVAAVVAVAGVWGVASLGTLPPADFTFCNGDQAKTADPHRATGQPENRVINGLFEGLLRSIPVEDGEATGPANRRNTPLKIVPGVAELPKISDDGLTYTFTLRKEAKWSNGRPMTAHDFLFSWQRLLHPETASEYAYQLHYVEGCEAYNLVKVAPGDVVEVEVADREQKDQPFPRGTIARGKLLKISEPPPLTLDENLSPTAKEDETAKWKRLFVYTVEVASEGQAGQSQSKPAVRYFAKNPAGAKQHFESDDVKIEACHNVLPDFDKTCHIKVLDDHTLEVKLRSPTAYFNELVAFYPLYPVCREAVEKHGTPLWTRPENFVGNGAFTLQMWRERDRIRLAKSDTYWNAASVKLNSVDVLAVKGDTTALNMYLTGQVDWINTVPNVVIPDVRNRDDFNSAPMLTVYMYRVNVERPPLDNVLVRRALNAAIDKQEICDRIMKAGQIPARSFVPPGMSGYESPQCGEFNLDEARRLLAEAGYPNGEGLPKVEILFNTNEDHATLAQVIQQQWAKLGIKCELRNLEWSSYLSTVSNGGYSVARAGWIGDYPDPNTFLDMFVTDGPNNQTNWSNKEYDRLIEESKKLSGEERLQVMAQAEKILMDELPILPVYFYVSKNMVNPRVKGFHSNLQDMHPLELLSIEE